jgi:DNA-binding CsgD family transcriptional regulator
MSDERRTVRRALVLFSIIALLIGADLIADFREGAGGAHLGVEGLVVLLAVVGSALGAQRLLALRRSMQALRAEVALWKLEAEELAAGLGVAIDRQFAEWGLSPAEREVGLLLLKGLSHREVASVRGTSERTVRQQARTLYKKAGLSGRADLAAFFLEDMLSIPGERRSPAPVDEAARREVTQ